MTGWKAPLATALLLGSVSAVPLLEGKQQLHDVNARASNKPLVDSESLQASIAAPQLLDRAKALYSIAQAGTSEYGHPTRVIGSAGHEGTLDYVYSTLSSLGDYYTVWNQSFSAVTGMVNNSRLEINGTVMESLPMSLTPSTTNKETVAGPLILVSNTGCDASDYPASVAGGIALIKRGNCTFTIKSQLAGNASALAAVVYNNVDDSLGGTLGEPAASQVATFAISGADAAPIVAALRNGTKLTATALMDSVVNVVQTKNILAQTVEGDANNCVMLGGHSDSVAEGPGINDDGTGSLGLLELATQLASLSVNNCVRFAWWAGEEEGLLGSDYYAESLSDEENLKIRLFMDYDMLGSPNFAYQVYDSVDSENPDGSQALRDLYIDWYNAHGLNYTLIPFDGRSDYDGFIRASIPAGGICTGAEGVKTAEEASIFGGKAGDWYDPCYHQLCDDVSNVNMTAWEVNSKLVAHSVATYALSFEGFPNRTLDDPATKRSVDGGRAMKYHGKFVQ